MIYVIIAVAFALQMVLCGVLVVSRKCVRSPCLLLLAVTVFSFIDITITLVNPASSVGGRIFSVFLSLRTASNFFANWSALLLFVTIVLFLKNRENAIRTSHRPQQGKGSRVLDVIHVSLAILLLVITTAITALQVEYNSLLVASNSARQPSKLLSVVYNERILDIWNEVLYVFTLVDVIVSCLWLNKLVRREGVRDQVWFLTLSFIATQSTDGSWFRLPK